MRPDQLHNQPSLLMLSDSFPDPHGGARAVRAWRLLCCAAWTHEVSLSVSPGNAVNLEQWRRVAGVVRRVHIESGRLRLFGSSKTQPGRDAWIHQHRFDVLLATSPRVWPDTCPVEARIQLCDFASRHDHAENLAVPQASLLERLTRNALRRPAHKSESEVIAECDHPLVATAEQLDDLPAGHSRAVVISGPGEMDVWARMFQQAHPLADFVTPEVTVIPIQPVPSRKAA